MPILKNPKHELFARGLAQGQSAAQAYVKAGFKPSTGNAAVLKSQQSILERIAEIQSEQSEMAVAATERAADALAIDREWIMARLKENAERALQARAVLDADGEATGEYKYEGNVANRALELLGKEIGMFIDRKDITHRDGDLDKMTDDELRRDVQERAARIQQALAGSGKARRAPAPVPCGRLN